MKFDWTPTFESDLKRLSEAEYRLFKKVAREDFPPALDRHHADPTIAWPRRLRIKQVAQTDGIYEMTWSFAGPDGRATFQWVMIDDDIGVRWRRIGGHEIFANP